MNTSNLKNNLIILILLLGQLAFSQETQLFRIIENNHFGFINNKGDQVIPPKYIDAEEFSEGLASVRVKGHYGFINTKGKMVIPPKYEYAGSFVNGIADVYTNGEVRFINVKGKRILPETYKTIEFIDKENILFHSKDNNAGVYNFKYSTEFFAFNSDLYSLGRFTDGVAIVRKRLEDGYETDDAVIDLKGNFIVDFGTYYNIGTFQEGYALVEILNSDDEDELIEGVINTKGELLFKKEKENNSYISRDGVKNGFAAMNLYKYWLPEEEGVSYSSSKSYMGYSNLKGEVVYNDTLIEYVYGFNDGRSIVRDKERDYYIIDTNFNRLNKTPFDKVLGNRFIDGYAVVDTDEGCGIINVNMNFIVEPNRNEFIHEVGVIDDSLYFYGTSECRGRKLYGIKHINGKTITQPILESFDRKGFKNGLLKAVINNRLSYLDIHGNMVWQETKSPQEKSNGLDITYMNRGYYYAYSKSADDVDYYNGWGGSSNLPKQMKESLNAKKELILEVKDQTLYVSNFSVDTIQFSAQDSRLNLKLQAKNKEGEWKDIEYLPSSWCGNSYHEVELAPKEYWSFQFPKYQGVYKTLIRAELEYIDPKTKEETKIYSQPFSGSVNPGQFWRKPEYSSRGIMDPYND